MMNRRTFVGALATVSGACALGLGGEMWRRRHLAPADLKPATLEPLRGQKVALRADETGRTYRAVLTDVSYASHPARHGAPGTEQVSLVLESAAADLEAGTYRIDNADVSLGRLFVSPVDGPDRHRRLEAVITRIV